MIETTRDIYRQKSALDTHLSILNLQKTMITALCGREVHDDMFWPKDARLLFGDIEDTLGEKIIDFERMRKQCDDIQTLVSTKNTRKIDHRIYPILKSGTIRFSIQ